MGAGKTRLAEEVAARLGRELIDVDALIERAARMDIPTIFRERGEPAFRELEELTTVGMFAFDTPGVLSLGGGAVMSERVRDVLREGALTVWIDVDADTAWQRVRGSDRPLAQDEADFRRLYEER